MTWTADMPDRRSCSDIVSWKAYVDRVFDEHRQQVSSALIAHDQRVLSNYEAASERLMTLHAHIEKIFEERQRATDIAEREREKSAQALSTEQRHASNRAEQEREKAAQALSQTLQQAIDSGDKGMLSHIQNQAERFTAALEAVEGRALLRHTSIQKEFDLRQRASDAAVQKAEEAQKEVNIRGNDYRSQLKDQNDLGMPRREAEALLKEVRLGNEKLDEKYALLIDKVEERVVANSTRMEKWESSKQGAVEVRTQGQVSQGQMLVIIGLVISIAAILFGAYT